MLVVCGEPAVNMMKTGSTVRYLEKKKVSKRELRKLPSPGIEHDPFEVGVAH